MVVDKSAWIKLDMAQGKISAKNDLFLLVHIRLAITKHRVLKKVLS